MNVGVHFITCWTLLLITLLNFTAGYSEFGYLGGHTSLKGIKSREEVKECTCVPFYLCRNNTFDDDKTELIDQRIDSSRCSNYLDVCCKTPHTENTKAPLQVKREGCGLRNENGIGFRISGWTGSQAQYGEFPWMMAIMNPKLVEGKFKNAYLCGGSLIHPKVVLTAAHCVVSKSPEMLVVRGGEWDTKSTLEFHPHDDKKVYKIIIHEEYYSGGLFNDIALLIVNEPFHKSKNLNIVCLPYQGDVVHDKDCIVAGWGKDSDGEHGHHQDILKRAKIPMVPRDTCEKALRQTSLGHHFKLHGSFVCAGGVEGGACKGDGGSALVCPVPHGEELQYQQVGIVSWGVGCGSKTPTVYANVANFVDWIHKELTKYVNKEEIKSDYHY